MSKILVTGANGFIGSHLVKQLSKLSHEVIVIELTPNAGDISKADTWRKLPQVDVVMHLAARSFVPDSWNEPSGFMSTNVTGTQNVLEYCRKYNAPLVFVSAYLYGIPQRLPIKETDPILSNNPYALSKYLAEQLCEFYANYWNLPITVIRPFNVYGFGQRPEFLIPEIIFQVRLCKEIRIRDLSPKRDYVYIDDLVDALIKSLNISSGYNVLNIGSGMSYSVGELIDVIQKVAGTEIPVYSKQVTRKQEISDVYADIDKAKDLLDWMPLYNLADGIAKQLQMEKINE
jgi:GDP-4-dehydro-6-deoxy-D-mannose reductase